MSSRFKAVTGFVVAGATLIVLADISPGFAIGTASLLLLGVLVAHSTEVSTLVSDWKAAVNA